MNKKLFLLIMIISYSFSFAQTKDSIANLNLKIDNIRLEMIEKDSLIRIISEQSNLLENKNEILTTTLNANTNIFNGLSTYFTLITILVSLIIIAIPIVNYFLVLKPNKETLSKLEKLETEIPNKIEKDFGIYMAGFEKRKAKQLIKSLKDSNELSSFTNFFFLSEFSDFDNDDQEIVISFLKNNQDIEMTDRLVLNSVLRRKPSIISESYYKQVIENEEKGDYDYAIEYLTENNFEKHQKFFEIIITASPKGHEIFLDIFKKLRDNYLGSPFDKKTKEKKKIGKEKIELLLNNDKICNEALKSDLPIHRKNEINANVINWNDFLKETKYIKKIIENNKKK